MAGCLKIATCQFAVSASVRRNSQRICDCLAKARKAGADIVHFPECAISGYASVDFKTFEGYDWGLLKEQTQKVIALAGKLKLWVVLGSAHRLTGPNKPHNCLYLIGPGGEIIDRYDKRFGTEVDVDNFTPGNRFVNFEINGVKCTLLICFDLRFPEIYRQLKKQKVDCVFQSFYNARQTGPSVHTDIMRQTMQCRAATNYFWVSMTNSSGYYSPYPSCFIRPDGKISAQLRSNRAGMMINTVDLSKKFYDPSAKFRAMAMKGKLTNGPGSIKDPRSRNRTVL
ncbi:MAG: carbon-nitrogen hydrolase family protein [Planctomycetota bacterium]